MFRGASEFDIEAIPLNRCATRINTLEESGECLTGSGDALRLSDVSYPFKQAESEDDQGDRSNG